jgi:hypothetical protein
MGLLNSTGPDDADLTPQPGIDQLPALIGRVRDAGLPVTFTVTGTPRPLPQGIGLTAYRVVQEALTNTVKHAVGASAHVTVAHERDALRVEVTDTGGTPGRSADTGNGRGLLGLRERITVYGGSLETERRLTGGFRVLAVIPLTGSGLTGGDLTGGVTGGGLTGPLSPIDPPNPTDPRNPTDPPKPTDPLRERV